MGGALRGSSGTRCSFSRKWVFACYLFACPVECALQCAELGEISLAHMEYKLQMLGYSRLSFRGASPPRSHLEGSPIFAVERGDGPFFGLGALSRASSPGGTYRNSLPTQSSHPENFFRCKHFILEIGLRLH